MTVNSLINYDEDRSSNSPKKMLILEYNSYEKVV